jgi:hypothetical protein
MDLGESIATVQRLLDAISTDLGNAPAWKRSTQWWADRAAEQQRLLAQREALRNRLADMALAN